MYRTCLHCRTRFPDNESIEALPIGRRLAFDAQRGRLWVVCRRCERWNLTPFDARWEAIEQAERTFRETRVRASTDQIGLARLRDGTELVRVGKPLRPEFAAWRYGDQFGRRRRQQALWGVGAVAATGLVATGALLAAGSIAVLLPVVQIATLATAVRGLRPGAPVKHPERGWITTIGTPRLISGSGESGWGVEVGVMEWYDTVGGHTVSVAPTTWAPADRKNEIGRVRLYGAEALPLMRVTLPRVNRSGARPSLIGEGVSLIEAAGGPEHFGRYAASQLRQWSSRQAMGDNGDLEYIPAPARLAFEMALHEDSERRALEGELATLEKAWAEAEGIAAIADSLAIPAAIEAKVDALRERPE